MILEQIVLTGNVTVWCSDFKFQSTLMGKKNSDGYEMNYKDLSPDQIQWMTYIVTILSIAPNNDYKHIHLTVLNLHAGLFPHWIRHQNIAGTICEAPC